MSTTTQNAIDFVRQLREHKALLETAQRLMDDMPQVNDPEVLRTVLSALGIPETPEHPRNAGELLQSRLRVDGEKLQNLLTKLAVAVYRRAVLVSDETTPHSVAVRDFGQNGTTVLSLDPSGKNLVAAAYAEKLPGDHPLKKLLPAALPRGPGGRPVLYLGQPTAGLDGAPMARGSYFVSDILTLTKRAAERERAEAEKIIEEERVKAERLKEANRTPTEIERLKNRLSQKLGVDLSDAWVTSGSPV